MAITLTTVRDEIETRLQDSTNLIYATATIDEAIRAALLDLSAAYGEIVFLKDLDTALATTFEDEDLNVLITGGVAYSLRFRLVGIYEEATPEQEHPERLEKWSTTMMKEFYEMIRLVRVRLIQEAEDLPYTALEWEEGDSFE